MFIVDEHPDLNRWLGRKVLFFFSDNLDSLKNTLFLDDFRNCLVRETTKLIMSHPIFCVVDSKPMIEHHSGHAESIQAIVFRRGFCRSGSGFVACMVDSAFMMLQ